MTEHQKPPNTKQLTRDKSEALHTLLNIFTKSYAAVCLKKTHNLDFSDF